MLDRNEALETADKKKRGYKKAEAENLRIERLNTEGDISMIDKKIEIFRNIHNENFENEADEEYFSGIFENSRYTVYCLKAELAEILGYAIYYDTSDSLDLFEIAVKKSKHGQGFGNFLLKNSVNEIFFLKNRNSVILEVNENNERAVRLYEANRFRKISVRRNYYGNGRNAIVMMRSNE